jgi:hypothetical protein
MQPGEGVNIEQKKAWAHKFDVDNPNAPAKLPWKFVATWQACQVVPTWNQKTGDWEHIFWKRDYFDALSVRSSILQDDDHTVNRDVKDQLRKIQWNPEPAPWPSPDPPDTPSLLVPPATTPATRSTNHLRHIDLRVFQGFYETALLETIQNLDLNVVQGGVQQVVSGHPLTTNAGPFFAQLWFEGGSQDWGLDKLKLYIGKTPYHENNGSDDAILVTDQSAPLANLFRANKMFGMPAPIVTKVDVLINVDTSTIRVQAFTDASLGHNYNWNFVWARFRAAERANELLNQHLALSEGEELRFR